MNRPQPRSVTRPQLQHSNQQAPQHDQTQALREGLKKQFNIELYRLVPKQKGELQDAAVGRLRSQFDVKELKEVSGWETPQLQEAVDYLKGITPEELQ